MRGIWIAAFLTILAGAAPAAAADLATLGCVRDQVPASALAEITASARGLADGNSPHATATLQESMTAAAASCATRYHWSDAARDAAKIHALVSLSLDAVRPLAKERGVSLDLFATSLAALTDAQRGQILGQEQAGTDALIAQLAAHGMPVANQAQGSLIGVMAVLTLFEQSQKARFIAS